jgi:GNAT superfamily N-acetyltransferase
MALIAMRALRLLSGGLSRWINNDAYRPDEVRARLRLDPAADKRTAAVHAAAARTGEWAALLPATVAGDLGPAAARLPTVVFWYRHGLPAEEIGRRLAPLGGAWDGERAIAAASSLIASRLNRSPKVAAATNRSNGEGGSTLAKLRRDGAGYDARVLAVLADNRMVRVRPIRPEDADGLVDLFGRLSRETVRRRFFTGAKEADPQEAAHFATVDGSDRLALVATAFPPPSGADVIVAVARYDRTEPDQAEAALLVQDSYQGRGLGRILLRRLVQLAHARGIRELHALLLPENVRALRLLETSGHPLAVRREEGLLHCVLRPNHA